MRQNANECLKSLRHMVGICKKFCLPATLRAIALPPLVASVLGLGLTSDTWAQSQSAQPATGGQVASPTTNLGQPATQDGAMTREEILALFQREAKAAYQMNKEACEGLQPEDKKSLSSPRAPAIRC
ncbi:MAG: hypothetical protein LRY56_06490 [Burkholderiaceae bacterium]|nr:hypothetical protein [Burkholderiaceae bacterium]